jgi:hypothetical protein
MSAMRAALLQGRPICPSIHRTLEYSEAFARRKGRTRPSRKSRGALFKPPPTLIRLGCASSPR